MRQFLHDWINPLLGTDLFPEIIPPFYQARLLAKQSLEKMLVEERRACYLRLIEHRAGKAKNDDLDYFRRLELQLDQVRREIEQETRRHPASK